MTGKRQYGIASEINNENCKMNEDAGVKFHALADYCFITLNNSF